MEGVAAVLRGVMLWQRVVPGRVPLLPGRVPQKQGVRLVRFAWCRKTEKGWREAGSVEFVLPQRTARFGVPRRSARSAWEVCWTPVELFRKTGMGRTQAGLARAEVTCCGRVRIEQEAAPALGTCPQGVCRTF